MVSGEGSVSVNSPAGLGLGQLLGTLLVPQLVRGMRRGRLLRLQLLSFLLLFSILLFSLLNFYGSACALSEFLRGTGCRLRDRGRERCE